MKTGAEQINDVSRGAEAAVYTVTVIYFRSNEKARFKKRALIAELRRVVRGILLYDYCCGYLRCTTPYGQRRGVGEIPVTSGR